MITWNTDVNAPCCPGEIVDNETGRTVLVQTDWDCPSVASTFGWSTEHIQRCAECGHVHPSCGYVCEECGHPGRYCTHNHTDGTVDCPDCGLTATDFISAAREYLDGANGRGANDPGYFLE